MVATSRPWYNGSYTMAAKPIKSLKLHYTMIQFLIIGNIQQNTQLISPPKTDTQMRSDLGLSISLTNFLKISLFAMERNNNKSDKVFMVCLYFYRYCELPKNLLTGFLSAIG